MRGTGKCVFLVFITSFVFASHYEDSNFGEKSYGVFYPDPSLTPGKIIEGITKQRICSPGYANSIRRDLSREDKIKVYKEYEVIYDTTLYQIDHFIPISLGGSNDLENLWVQPIENNMGYFEKQQVANYLHQLVCNGDISLLKAQSMVLEDWHKVYIEKMHGHR